MSPSAKGIPGTRGVWLGSDGGDWLPTGVPSCLEMRRHGLSCNNWNESVGVFTTFAVSTFAARPAGVVVVCAVRSVEGLQEVTYGDRTSGT